MDIKQLDYFINVAETENITQAAKKMYISQSAVTQSIHELEKELGVQLFDRINRRIELNDAGRVFLQRAKNILAEYDFAKIELLGFKESNPTVRVGSVSGAIAENIKSVFTTDNLIGIDSHFISEEEAEEGLRCNEYDVVIANKKVEGEEFDSAHIKTDVLSIVVPKNDSLAAKTACTVKDLEGKTIVFARNNGKIGVASQSLIFSLLKEQINVKFVMESDILKYYDDMEISDDVYLISSYGRISRVISDKKLVIPLESTDIKAEYYLNYHKQRSLKVNYFIKKIIEHFS